MRVNHRPHESQTGKGRKPSETLTPREIDLIRALDGMARAGVAPSTTRLAAWLGVTGSTVCFLRDGAIAHGGIASTGYGATRKLSITPMGYAAIGGADG